MNKPQPSLPHESILNGKTVNRVCLSLLIQELVPVAIRVNHSLLEPKSNDKEEIQTRINSQLSVSEDLPGTTSIYKSDFLISDDTAYRMERCGFHLGMRLVATLMFSQANDVKMILVLDVMKFLCKDLWKALYGKQIDSLRTNHRGTYVLIDNKSRSIASLSSSYSTSEMISTAKVHLKLPCGIIRGAINSLGIEALVSAEIKLFPAVEFSIQTSEEVKS